MRDPASILILAAEPSVREMIRRAAEEFGRVVITHKPALAIYFARAHEPTVAILDLDVVPPQGRSGLVSTLRERFRLSIVAVGDVATIDDAAALGLTMVLKPLNGSSLMKEIDRALSERLGTQSREDRH